MYKDQNRTGNLQITVTLNLATMNKLCEFLCLLALLSSSVMLDKEESSGGDSEAGSVMSVTVDMNAKRKMAVVRSSCNQTQTNSLP